MHSCVQNNNTRGLLMFFNNTLLHITDIEGWNRITDHQNVLAYSNINNHFWKTLSF